MALLNHSCCAFHVSVLFQEIFRRRFGPCFKPSAPGDIPDASYENVLQLLEFKKPEMTRKWFPSLIYHNRLIKFNYNCLIPNSGCLSNFKIISAHRKNINLEDILVRARLPALELGLKITVRYNCDSFFQYLTFVRNPVSHLLLRVTQRVHPTDHNCIYLLVCDRCGKQYVGETKNSILTRLWQHRHNAIHNLELHTPLMQHVHDWSSIKVAGLQCNVNWTVKKRKMQERKWIFLLGSRHPHGLNKQLRSSL